MADFVEGLDQAQSTLLPECLEDWVYESNPVRVIDALVESIDLRSLGFDGADAAGIGRAAYHSKIHLKLYICGYLNRVQSSRRLAREADRNLEVKWLLGRPAPDFKTIADFRKDNGAAIRKVCAQFIEICRKLDLMVKASVAIDGSKFKAVNNRDKNFTTGKIERWRKQLEESVARYLAQLETADRHEPSETITLKKTRIAEKLEKLKVESEKLAAIEKQVQASPDGQISLTDLDSRSMATSGRGSGVVGYNVQTAVDTENHLIIAHEVTNVGSDRSQLASTAKEALHVDKLDVVVDRGYFSGEEIKACDDAGITVTQPKPMTSGAKSEGRFGKQDFVYLAADDTYRCPAGEVVTYRFTTEDRGQKLRKHSTNACGTSALKAQCTTAKLRLITRLEHEDVVEAVQERLDKDPQAMRRRHETVEHSFGTLKMRMGATPFLCKTLPKVATEMVLCVLTYNLTRVLNIVGVEKLLEAVRG